MDQEVFIGDFVYFLFGDLIIKLKFEYRYSFCWLLFLFEGVKLGQFFDFLFYVYIIFM